MRQWAVPADDEAAEAVPADDEEEEDRLGWRIDVRRRRDGDVVGVRLIVRDVLRDGVIAAGHGDGIRLPLAPHRRNSVNWSSRRADRGACRGQTGPFSA